MNCANHDTAAVAFCRTCGKPLCGICTRDVRGVVYCESCLAARLDATAPAAGFVPPAQTVYPQAVYPPMGTPIGTPVAPMRPAGSGPNPAVAGILAGFFPVGVGAVYCSQYAKGLAYLVIMALFWWGTDHTGGAGGFFVAAVIFFWIFQIIDAVRTARALQEGLPAPDPFGLGQTFSLGERSETKNIPMVAIVLIGLGVLFLLHTMNIWEFGLDRFWPLILIFFGGWMFARQWGLVGGYRTACRCDRCRMRKITGPVVLMTVGLLFLLQSLNIADFDRTWPAILLVIGVVKLLQSSASSAGHTGPLPPGAPVTAPPPPPPTVPMPAPGQEASAPSSSASSSASGEVRNV